MINELDEALRRLLLRDDQIKENRIDISFDQPKGDWSAKLSRATLNLFLYDVRENSKLRQTRPAWEVRPHNGDSVTRHRRPVRLDLHYMLTAWATEPDDEHYLLTVALMALFRTPELPVDLLPDRLQEQPVPICLTVAQEDILRNPAEIWSAMENQLRPSVPVVVTLALNPYEPMPAVKIVKERGLRFEPHLKRRDKAYREQEDAQEEDKATHYRWTIGGTVTSDQPLDFETIRLILVEAGVEVRPHADGRFSFGNLTAGDYNLEIYVGDRRAEHKVITVPSADFEVKL